MACRGVVKMTPMLTGKAGCGCYAVNIKVNKVTGIQKKEKGTTKSGFRRRSELLTPLLKTSNLLADGDLSLKSPVWPSWRR